MAIKISFTSLGCDKNLVDSEVMLALINKEGYEIVTEDDKADVIIINTCCFINDAKEESINNIIELGQYKKTGACKALIVTGCLGQRYKEDIFKELPEVDAVIGTGDYESIIEVIKETLQGKKVQRTDNKNKNIDSLNRIISTTGYYDYLKIAEGCNNRCTYCIIPKLRGEYRSRSIESLVNEAQLLAGQGVKELILVAQDTTKYGIDLYNKKMLPTLLKELCKIDDIKWIRLMYCYPEEITDELIETIATEEKVCKYIDMPIQHSNDNILKRMARKSNQKQLRDVIQKLRNKIPDICLRTTLITGFPGETDEEFNDLLKFVEDIKFDRLGVFTYSQEEDTPAALFKDQVDEEIKLLRKDKIMNKQKDISHQINSQMIGKTLKVIVDGKLPNEDVYCCRTYKDGPEIDGFIFVKSNRSILSGTFLTAKVVGAYEYDLIGEIIDECSE